MSKDSFQQLIRLPSYMRLWFARLSGTMGSQMLMVAVGWQIMFAKDILHVGPWGLGLLRSVPALGAVMTAVVFGMSTHFVLSLAALAVSGGVGTLLVAK